MNYVLIKKENGYVEYPCVENSPAEQFAVADMPFHRWIILPDGTEAWKMDERNLSYELLPLMSIAEEKADICIDRFSGRLAIENHNLTLYSCDADCYLNGKRIRDQKRTIELQDGDILLIGDIQFVYNHGMISIYGDTERIHTKLLPGKSKTEEFEGFPNYKRSPRIIKRVPKETIEIAKPPEKKRMSGKGLAQVILPPLCMMCVTVAVSILLKRGLYIVMSLSTTLMTLVFSVIKYFNDKKDCKEQNARRLEMYDEYILSMRKKIYEAYQKEKEAYAYNYPSLREIENLIHDYSSRIYERNSNDDDFLHISLGEIRDTVSFPVKITYDPLKVEKDPLELEAKAIRDEFAYIDHKPVIVDLKKTHLGIVGEKAHIHEQLKLIIAQLTFAQSYHDLQIINIFDSKYNEDFLWTNWYPHVGVRAVNVSGNVNSERMRDQVLGTMTQILKERKLKADENKKEARYTPHYVIIIDEPKLIMEHPIMEYLAGDGEKMGFTIIYTTHLRANLPEYIHTVWLLQDSEQGELLLAEKAEVNRKMRLGSTEGIDLEWMARDLSVLVHEQGVVSHIPDSITFFDMYQVKKPDELNVEERWQKHEARKSLAAPLGVRAVEDYVYLNLHEKAHGPHGLVGGTTGSGKSELIQSYILSMAVNFHPYEVSFLLIDYKGGGMAGLFKNLPHLLGVITNLDGSESLRALASIKSELARRQRIFSANNVNHIDDYNKLFKLHKVSEPIPHMFMISDEFAELKKEQPEFMKELVSTARIGRSLGIHLILATQQPSGVVDDQIWTNSHFKIALKLQNESDSREILKTPDAASITQAGRAYLQVGNNEVYELFQSAWSGAAYHEDGKKAVRDNRVYVVNDLRQGELVTGDLSDQNSSEIKLRKTQLDVTVDYLKEAFEAAGLAYVKKPWLPSLPDKLLSPLARILETPEWKEQQEIPESAETDLAIPFGIADIPEEQAQREYTIDLKKEGNVAYFASSGFGKSTVLMTAALSLALKNTVEALNYYVIDFGNSGLIMLNSLPHTADYMQMDDIEKMAKFVKLIQEELKNRKKLFAKKLAQNITVYNETAGEPLKSIIIFVDHFDVVKEMGAEMEEFFTKVGRDGPGMGIYLVISAIRTAGVRYATLNNFKIKIAGFLFEDGEANSIVGRSSYQLPETKGRALVKLDNVNVMQMYTMTDFTNEIEYNVGIQSFINSIASRYPGRTAPRIAVLPEQFEFDMIPDYSKSKDGCDVVLGLDVESVELRGFFRTQSPFVIVGDAGQGKTNALKVILEQLQDEDGEVYLFDSKSLGLYDYAMDVNHIQTEEEALDMVDTVNEMCQKRKELLQQAIAEKRTKSPKEFYGALPACYIIIDDADDFMEAMSQQMQELTQTLELAAECGISVIISAHASKMRERIEFTRWIRSATNGLVLGNPGILTIFPVSSSREYTTVLGQGLLFKNGASRKILMPNMEL